MTRVAPKTVEDVGPTRRRPMTLTRKRRIHAFWNGCCGGCGVEVPLTGKGVIYDHEITVWMGGPDDDGPNTRPHCPRCDKPKTAKDQAEIAHVKRLRGETGNGPKRKIAARPFDKPNVKPGVKPRWPKRRFQKRKATTNG